jgi:hypothetical protein
MKPKELKIPEWIEKMQEIINKAVTMPKKQVPEWLEG